jgi:hypothetical protein
VLGGADTGGGVTTLTAPGAVAGAAGSVLVVTSGGTRRSRFSIVGR